MPPQDPGRFKPWEAAASLRLRAGDPTAAQAYADHGRLATVHPALLPDLVARRHLTHDAHRQSVAITTSTAETARRINVAIQRATAPPVRVDVRLADGTVTGLGDTIATRRNDPTLLTDRGERVRNRHTWTVTDTRRDGSITVEHPDRGTVRLPADYVSAHVELGWAVTGYGNQGDTTDVGIAVLEPHTTRAHAYVALTRGRHANTALIVDETGSLDPASGLASIGARSPATKSALATRERLTGANDTGVDPSPFTPDRREAILRRLDQLSRGDRSRSVPHR